MRPQIAVPPSEKRADFSPAYAMPLLVINLLNLTTRTMDMIKLIINEQAYGIIAMVF